MHKHVDDIHNVILKIRKSSKTSHSIDNQLILKCMRKLSDELNLYDCDITVSFIKQPSYESGNVQDLGNRNYYITVERDFTTIEAIETIVHEFIHIHQLSTGTLRLHSNGNVVWRGKLFRYSKGGKMKLDKNILGYSLFPWEIDATKREDDLFELLRPDL